MKVRTVVKKINFEIDFYRKYCLKNSKFYYDDLIGCLKKKIKYFRKECK